MKTIDSSVFPYLKWDAELASLSRSYQSAGPYPHIVLENFLAAEALHKALQEFPDVRSGDWIHYLHVNEKKYGKNNPKQFGPAVRQVIDELNSPAFVAFLGKLTGIQGLFADPALEGGGLHQSVRGGYLNIHADFTVHPHHRHWRRRVNVLVYLNEAWEDSYGGHLELWDRQMKTCRHKVLPVFNRAVIFNTDADAFHGHPEPLKCPENASRKSIALYYFTEEKTAPKIQSTEYRARPGDGLKALWIYLDKMLLRVYDQVKRTFKLDDQFASNLLQRISNFFNPPRKP